LEFDFSTSLGSHDRIFYRASYARDLGLAYQITKKPEYAQKAKEALIAIKEHQEYVENLHRLHPTKEKYTNRDWFRKEDPEHSIRLRDDFNKYKIISCFWVGYFEHIQSTEIIQEDNDLKIEF
jgi:uncharacterized short protein YbdD (DUF466 family)